MVSAACGGGDGDRMHAQQLSDRGAQAGSRRAEAAGRVGPPVFTAGSAQMGSCVAEALCIVGFHGSTEFW
jgi:hypothetical protein